jgi:hypothetical protein
MALQRVVTEEEYGKLEPAKQSVYVRNGDGAYHLDVQDDETPAPPKRTPPPAPAAKTGRDVAFETLKEEKRQLREKLEEWEVFLGEFGVDKETVKRVLEEKRKIDEKELIDKGEVETLLAKREEQATKRMREAHEKAMADRDQRIHRQDEQLKKQLIDGAVMAGCVAHGVRKSALKDVLGRAREVFFVTEEGEVHAKGPDGPWYSKNGGPLTFDEWFADLATNAEHLFEPNEGGGTANPAARGAGHAGLANVRKSQLTDKQKSDLIDELGAAEYKKLPP